jgi:hypothetical protein
MSLLTQLLHLESLSQFTLGLCPSSIIAIQRVPSSKMGSNVMIHTKCDGSVSSELVTPKYGTFKTEKITEAERSFSDLFLPCSVSDRHKGTVTFCL